ncbi:hypothetical protein JKF63_04459 [Porcisia hertigi]|uniref:Uncharacterized protein n=1 Tax=Porcisia hertigi TaxID=2761500 RepID=A0A836LCB2_9TRYP|nr:hypothetical protein JKF63_04459 [Porcisia hertigi]
MSSQVAGDSSDSRRSDILSGSTGSTVNSVASSAPPVTVSFVTSAEEFAAVFGREGSLPSATNHHEAGGGDIIAPSHSRAGDALLLCYEHPGDGVTAEGLVEFQKSVTSAAQEYGTRLRLFIWDCTHPSFASARFQLEKTRGHPLLLIVYKGSIADTLRDIPLTEMSATEVPRVCSRLASLQSSAKPARVVSTSEASSEQAEAERHLSVDVAKMVGMGKKLMAERQPFYAEKFFVKALQTLDAVATDVGRLVESQDDYDQSVALCLAWAGLAQLVQGKHIAENPYLERLGQQASLQRFCDEPLSDASRAMTTWRLMQGAPRPWSETLDSEARLRAALSASPLDFVSRSLLVITLFLKGDLERAMTEALKLHVSGDAFGRAALKHMSRFLGREHVLVRGLGMPALSEST